MAMENLTRRSLFVKWWIDEKRRCKSERYRSVKKKNNI